MPMEISVIQGLVIMLLSAAAIGCVVSNSVANSQKAKAKYEAITRVVDGVIHLTPNTPNIILPDWESIESVEEEGYW